ncbi:MAG: cytochrome B [Saprospiraceae bacterium]|nr:cytochrome B [Saprospiraceae bacterium]
MLNGIKHAHSGLRWVVLALLLFAIFNAFNGWRQKKSYTSKDKKIHLFTMIFVHIQVLIGLLSYYLNWGAKVNFKSGMGDPLMRFFTVEHLTIMLLALVVITFGFSRSKKIIETPRRFRFIFITYLVGLALILAGIPWPFRELGAGWF